MTEAVRGKLESYLTRVRVRGGTNIHDSLKRALGQKTEEGFLPMVLFLTDGLPTIGETSEKKIREMMTSSNGGHRRIFTFGVGVDVNTPLLSRLANESRATSTFVLPEEDVELKVAKVFQRLSGPVLETPVLKVKSEDGGVMDLLPGNLPDLFEDDQLVVVGRYQGKKEMEFVLSGSDGKNEQKYRFDFAPQKNKEADYIPRLWASRKIAVLTEALRDLGADGSTDRQHPKFKELVDEIVRLSTEHGILTEYTAFLAREGEVFRGRDLRNSAASLRLEKRALKERSGFGAYNQEANLSDAKQRSWVAKNNNFLNENMEREVVKNVQQIGRKTYFQRGTSWFDAEAVDQKDDKAKEVKIGSPEFGKLVDRLVSLNQQSSLAMGVNMRVVVDGVTYQIK